MAQMMEYKCPCCGGAIEFDSTIQKLKCPYCDTEFDMEAVRIMEEELQEEKQDNLTWENQAGSEWSAEETENMRVYICQSCGGEIVADETQGATSCPYCGNNVVMKEQFAGDLKPDYVIPFKLDKRAAKERLKMHFQGKKLLPKCFKEENHLEEIKGIYVPFWLFDGDAEGEVRFQGTKVRTWSDSNYIYTQTSFYDIVRGGSIKFERVPVDGSSKMPDDLMESLEPYDFSEAVEFEPAYLAGFLADRYDVSAEQSAERANERIKKSTEYALEDTITDFYTTKVPMGSHVNLKNGKAKYALYPVWILNTTWNGQSYVFAMNGQTGKFVGNLPIDKKAYWKHHIKWTAIVGCILYIVTMLTRMM